MAPTGASKDERMASFTRCITALLGEMLYVENIVMIAPIDINNNDNKHFIQDQDRYPLELHQARKTHYDKWRKLGIQ